MHYNCSIAQDRDSNLNDTIVADLFLPHSTPKEIRKAKTISQTVIYNSYRAYQLADRLKKDLRNLSRWGKASHIYDYHKELNELVLSLDK